MIIFTNKTFPLVRRALPTYILSLLLLSALGGSVAMYVTMLMIRHKTRHSKFMIGIPIIILFQAVVLLYLSGFIG